ncbi:MAG: IS66 family insertion sequence element accessory protein TnpB [Rhodocyclaceae bacterium]|nr:IS66 family insertion sequence element accessory protein TnpB [Rhodocyclaceae bacterium]
MRVHLYGQPADMRKSFDGLFALARHAMGLAPLRGHLFAFVNRSGKTCACPLLPAPIIRRTLAAKA